MPAHTFPGRDLPQDTPLWRFIDLAKLLAMLDASSLFLVRADLLGDEHEGASSHVDAEVLKQAFSKIGVPEESHRHADIRQTLRSWTFISCWFASRSESKSMSPAINCAARASNVAACQSPLAPKNRP